LATVALAACAPTVDGPLETQRAVDRSDADRLSKQLEQLPGAVNAEVTLHRPFVDPLAPAAQASTPGGAAILIVVDDRADRAAIERAAATLARATAPEVGAPAIVVEVGATRPALAQVGPFTVEAGSRGRLVAALACAFAAVAALAGWVAWRERWRLARSRRVINAG
jgi:hypothetical protein